MLKKMSSAKWRPFCPREDELSQHWFRYCLPYRRQSWPSSVSQYGVSRVNRLMAEQNYKHFADDIFFQIHFLAEIIRRFIFHRSLLANCSIDNNSASFRVMVWCRTYIRQAIGWSQLFDASMCRQAQMTLVSPSANLRRYPFSFSPINEFPYSCYCKRKMGRMLQLLRTRIKHLYPIVKNTFEPYHIWRY